MQAGRWVVVAMLAGAAALAYLGFVLRSANAPPTVVLVTLDTFRADRIGRTPTITPHLDALVARGVTFERASTVAPLTVPAHATFLTGLLPPRHGLRLNDPAAPLPGASNRQFFTLAEVMKDKGYATGAFVSASVLRGQTTGLDAGFDVYDEVPPAAPGAPHDTERPGRGQEAVEKALAFLADKGRSTFVWVHLFDAHAPYDAPPGWGAGAEHVSDATGYDAEIAYVDHCVGLLVKGLKEQRREDAVVVVVADHGEGLGEHGEATHGYLLHEATLHVPLIFATPILAPTRRSEPVSVVDVFPTVLALAGLPVPPQINGTPLFAKDASAAIRPLYAETLYGWIGCNWAQTFSLRRDSRKLVASGPVTLNFDLSSDPGEERSAAIADNDRQAIQELMVVARMPSIAGPGTPSGDVPAGSYWSSAGRPPVVLSDAENAALPSPYERMDVVRQLDSARTLYDSGQFAAALAAFDAVVAKDPRNIQAHFWRASCLGKLKRPGEAAAGFEHTYELGMRSSDCVTKAIQNRLIESGTSDASAWQRGIDFLEHARGRRTPSDAGTYVFEAFYYLSPGHEDPDKAREALRRAESLPRNAKEQEGVEMLRQTLDALTK